MDGPARGRPPRRCGPRWVTTSGTIIDLILVVEMRGDLHAVREVEDDGVDGLGASASTSSSRSAAPRTMCSRPSCRSNRRSRVRAAPTIESARTSVAPPPRTGPTRIACGASPLARATPPARSIEGDEQDRRVCMPVDKAAFVPRKPRASALGSRKICARSETRGNSRVDARRRGFRLPPLRTRTRRSRPGAPREKPSRRSMRRAGPAEFQARTAVASVW